MGTPSINLPYSHIPLSLELFYWEIGWILGVLLFLVGWWIYCHWKAQEEARLVISPPPSSSSSSDIRARLRLAVERLDIGEEWFYESLEELVREILREFHGIELNPKKTVSEYGNISPEAKHILLLIRDAKYGKHTHRSEKDRHRMIRDQVLSFLL